MTKSEVVGSRVVVKSLKDNKIVVDSKIVDYNSFENVIYISASTVLSFNLGKLGILIFTDKHLYEYQGILNDAICNNMYQIALAKGGTKECRTATRYNICLNGTVDAVYIDSVKIPLRVHIPVSTIDMSAVGVLLRSVARMLDKGITYHLIVNSPAGNLLMKFEVVRITYLDSMNAEYGCKVRDMHRE